MTKPSNPRQRPHVRLRAVPPIRQRIGQRSFPGSDILEENSGESGLLLWLSYRDAELWSAAGLRSDLFFVHELEFRRTAIYALEPVEFDSIKSALLTLAELVLPDEAPVPNAIASECETIAGWSEMRNRLGTAVEYAQVASFTVPDHPMYALRAARLLRMRAEYDRALTWFDHAVVTARQQRDWTAYAQAFSGLGCLYLQRENYRRARVMLKRALRTGMQHRLPERVGAAYHNLFAVEASTENWELAEHYAELALSYYPSGSRGLPRLARDLAFRWLERGYFERALPLAREVLQHFTAPADRALVWSDVARAAAGCSEAEIFEDAWAQAYAITQQQSTEPFTIDILLNLAHAAASRNDAIRGRMTAQRAAALAQQYSHGVQQAEAEAILGSLIRGVPTHARTFAGTAELATRFVQVLRRARAAA